MKVVEIIIERSLKSFFSEVYFTIALLNPNNIGTLKNMVTDWTKATLPYSTGPSILPAMMLRTKPAAVAINVPVKRYERFLMKLLASSPIFWRNIRS
jgi:hypothetical protein